MGKAQNSLLQSPQTMSQRGVLAAESGGDVVAGITGLAGHQGWSASPWVITACD